jgi:hypothetical protein
MNIPDPQLGYKKSIALAAVDSLSVFSYCAVRMTQNFLKIHPPEN